MSPNCLWPTHDEGEAFAPPEDIVARAAGPRGRLGLASMRRRAQAIEADLSVAGTGKGNGIRGGRIELGIWAEREGWLDVDQAKPA